MIVLQGEPQAAGSSKGDESHVSPDLLQTFAQRVRADAGPDELVLVTIQNGNLYALWVTVDPTSVAYRDMEH